MDPAILERWKRATIHLECAADSEHVYKRMERIRAQQELFSRGKITQEQFVKELAVPGRDIRQHGTALFLVNSGRHYLLTARHVVWDKRTAERELKSDVYRFPGDEQRAAERAQNRVFDIIFRVPTVDEITAPRDPNNLLKSHRRFLMNLGVGGSSTFSVPDVDLALISLDSHTSSFSDQLMTLGYVPAAFENVADGPEAEGQELFTIGYPSATALLGQINQHPASAHWSSSFFSLPVSSFGRVSMLHKNLPFFWADISIYPGNSGGPVVANDRLVGIVSQQAMLPIDDVPEVRTRIPFGRIIKTSFVRGLLEEQLKKDQHMPFVKFERK
jgi:hypothetical protein